MKHSNFVQFLHLITVVPRSFLFMTAVTYRSQSCKKSKSRTTIRQSKNLYHDHHGNCKAQNYFLDS